MSKSPDRRAGMPFYKCEPIAFNEGMLGLTLEERGAYCTLINAIYAAGGPVRDDAAKWSAVLGCRESVWAKVRSGLIKKERIRAVEIDGKGHLTDDRCELELTAYWDHIEELRRRGGRGGKNKSQNQRDGSELAPAKQQVSSGLAGAKQQVSDSLAEPYQIEIETETEKEEEESSEAKASSDGGASSRARPKRPIPGDWAPSEIDEAYAAKHGFGPAQISTMAERFANHARQQDRRCADWQHAWRNWVLEERKRSPLKPKRQTVW